MHAFPSAVAFLPVAAVRQRVPTWPARAPCCCAGGAGAHGDVPVMSARPRRSRWRAISTAGAALALALGAAAPRARAEPVKLTEQVANFTLPSRESAEQRGASRLVMRVVGVAKVAVPVGGGIALAAWLISKMLRRAQEKQLRDFQAQLQSFSTMLDLDTAALDSGTATSRADAKDAAGMARDVLQTTRYRFREEGEKEKKEGDVEGKVRLDLFKAAKGEKPDAREGASDLSSAIADIDPADEYEVAVAKCLAEISVAPTDAEVVKKAVRNLASVQEAQGVSKESAESAFNLYVGRVVSMQIDRVAVHLDSDDRESLKNLHALASTMTSSQAFCREEGRSPGLQYVGIHQGDKGMKTREELYRRYAVFCLSSEERIRDDLQSLADMQMLLSVSDSRAELINKEIAKGMFQVAVSAAMADGGLDEGSKDSLEKLKESFGDFLEGGAADSIVSEVAVMRAMYSLQQLLQEQGVSEEDVSELRRMCSELGVDIDEMLQNADALGNVLGPEAKEFVVSLRDLLANGGVPSSAPSPENSVLTTAVNVDSSTATPESGAVKGAPEGTVPRTPGATGE